MLTNVDHQMSVMREESFGPIVGIMKVRNDEEAIALMNDSPYGLTRLDLDRPTSSMRWRSATASRPARCS